MAAAAATTITRFISAAKLDTVRFGGAELNALFDGNGLLMAEWVVESLWQASEDPTWATNMFEVCNELTTEVSK